LQTCGFVQLDAFAGGFLVQSLLALWVFSASSCHCRRPDCFSFGRGILAALSVPVAASLSRRIGLVNTMVFTHVPSNLCLILAAVGPNLPTALALLLLRAALSQMDVPTRDGGRACRRGEFTSAPRLRAVSPALAGALFAASFRALPLIICGVLKILYDVLLLQFRHLKPPEEQYRSKAASRVWCAAFGPKSWYRRLPAGTRPRSNVHGEARAARLAISGRINKLSRSNRGISDGTEPKGSDNKELSTSPFED
jgi:hypothetical protein